MARAVLVATGILLSLHKRELAGAVVILTSPWTPNWSAIGPSLRTLPGGTLRQGLHGYTADFARILNQVSGLASLAGRPEALRDRQCNPMASPAITAERLIV
jgi:hypothetical protein